MKIFILDYDTGIYEYYNGFFKYEFPKVEIYFFNQNQTFLEKIQMETPDLVLIEFEIEKPLEIYKTLLEKKIPFIITTRLFNERLIVEILKLGAYDYILKQNFKLDYLKKIIARALLDAPRWKKLEEIKKQLDHFPEFGKYDLELKEIAFVQFKSIFLENYPLPPLENGINYKLNFFTLRLPITSEMNQIYSELSFTNYYSDWLNQILSELKKYKCEILIQKNDAFTAIFHHQNFIEPIIASLRIKLILLQILSNLEISRLDFVCCIEQGTMIYQTNKANLYSEAINFSYHLTEKIPFHNSHLYITENIYKNLPNRIKRYFFKIENFENIPVYYFDYVS